MRIDVWTLALQAINFAVLVWLLQRFLYKPVLGMLDARRAEIEKQYADARAAEQEAQSQLAEIESERQGIEAERQAALQAATAQASEAATQRRARAEAEANALVADARAQIASERTQALAEARHIALDLGVDVARHLLAEIPAELRAEVWLDRVEDQLRGLSPEDRAHIDEGLARDGALRVVSAIALPEPLTEKFKDRLRAQLGTTTRIVFDVDPEIVAGIELQFPNLILRFSWRATLAAMRAEIEANTSNHAQHR